jgi:hypothetical protein
MDVAKEKIDRRSSSRLPVSVELEGRRNGDVFEGTCVNVSETGILIQTNKSLNLGDRITIRLITPGQDEIVGGGKVIRYDDFGFGKFAYAVHWELNVNQKSALKEWLSARNK